MTLKIYAVSLELVRHLAAGRSPLDARAAALFQQVIGTLVRLVQPR